MKNAIIFLLIFNQVVSEAKPGLLPDGETRLTTTNVEAPSFKEGYVKARVINEYGDVGDDLAKFINDEFKSAISGMKDQMSSADFDKTFSKAIENYRKENTFDMDPKIVRLIKALDILGEVPFANSNNIDDELMAALTSSEQISTAQTGDDLFIVLKEEGEVRKVIGADARGLGVLNISSRLELIANSFENGEEITSMDKLYELSLESIEQADDLMEAHGVQGYFGASCLGAQYWLLKHGFD